MMNGDNTNIVNIRLYGVEMEIMKIYAEKTLAMINNPIFI